MYQLVVSALQKSRINGHYGQQTLAGQACRKGDGMLFGDGDIKIALGETPGKFDQSRTLTHGWGDAHDARVLRGGITQPLTKDLRIGGSAGLLFEDSACGGIEGTRAVPLDGIGFSRRIALALGGHHMQKLRAGQLADVLQSADQTAQIVTVYGAQIVEAHLFEQRAR